jgi:hypothetical protein
VIKFIRQELRSEIRENQRAEQEGLPKELKALRPDMIFEQRDRSPRRREEREEEGEQTITEIIEFSCPYGCISHGRDTLEKTYEAKRAKYEELARALSNIRHEKVRMMAIIVSAMGAGYGPSMKDLQKILRCNNKEMKKLERKCQRERSSVHWRFGRTTRCK